MIKRYLLLKSMDQIIRSLDDDFDYYNKWVYYVPEDSTDEDFEMRAESLECFNRIAKVFIEIIIDNGSGGFFVV